METMTVHQAVRKATDPFGIDGEGLSFQRPSTHEVEKRLATLGFRVHEHPLSHEITESEERVLDGNR